MHHEFSPAVEHIISAKMATGKYENENELMMAALASLDTEEDDSEGLQEAIDLLERGVKGVSLDEAFERLRTKYDLKDGL